MSEYVNKLGKTVNHCVRMKYMGIFVLQGHNVSYIRWHISGSFMLENS